MGDERAESPAVNGAAADAQPRSRDARHQPGRLALRLAGAGGGRPGCEPAAAALRPRRAHARTCKRDSRASLLFDGTARTRRPADRRRASPCWASRSRSRMRASWPASPRGTPRPRPMPASAIFTFIGSTSPAPIWSPASGASMPSPRAALSSPAAPALAAAEGDILEHMNADHGEAIALYATRLAGAGSGDGWRMTGIDPEGIDLRRGGSVLRLDFPAPVGDAKAARSALVRLAQQARTMV